MMYMYIINFKSKLFVAHGIRFLIFNI